MAGAKVIIVTGANRGIGLAICETILRSHEPVKLYACSRAGKDLNLSSSSSQIEYPKLDVTKSDQISSLASIIKSSDSHVDVLINNAGLNKLNANNPSDAKEIIGINYYGTSNMCQTFLPLMSKQGRIVNVSSIGSSLGIYPKDIQSKFRNPDMNLDDIDALAAEYMSAIEAGDAAKWGSRASPYSVSKACVNALTATLARENSGTSINCCCPGWVDTDMGSIVGQPPKSPADGAKIPVRLGFGDLKGVSGRYWADDSISETGEGKVQQW